MPRINYRENVVQNGMVFNKDEIFYGDRLQSEWDWLWFHWWRLIIVAILLYGSFFLGLLFLFDLFFWAKPRNRLILVGKTKIVRRSGEPKGFSYGPAWSLDREKVVDIEVFLSKGEVCIFKKGIFSNKSETARLKDIGRGEELVELLKKYEYPVVVHK